MHALVGRNPPTPRERSIAYFAEDFLVTTVCAIRLSAAEKYRPSGFTRQQLRAAARMLCQIDGKQIPPADLTAVWTDVTAAVRSFDLHAARKLLQGFGGGLTPTGDDVLAGILLFSNWLDPSNEIASQVAEKTDTSDLSRSFLIWAARGQSIEPIHALVRSAADLGSSRAKSEATGAYFAHMLAKVRSIGSSSGVAMLAGLRLAAAAWLAADHRTDL
ncbi:DUF2877 domain-containing protein [Ensifer adhaerens]|nr:DUF2877 domain-containing protein [Ensifer canadensis]